MARWPTGAAAHIDAHWPPTPNRAATGLLRCDGTHGIKVMARMQSKLWRACTQSDGAYAIKVMARMHDGAHADRTRACLVLGRTSWRA